MKLRYCVVLVLFLLTTAHAVVMQSIYTGNVPVINRGDNLQPADLAKAFDQVLVKVSGNIGVVTLPSVKQALPDASDLVRSFNYTTTKGPNQQTINMLHVVFDKHGINALLQKNGQAIWGVDRPLIIAWVVNANNDSVMKSESQSDIAQALAQTAQIRGVPLVLPMMDLQDMSLVSPSTLLQASPAALKHASKRYGAQGILVGSVNQMTNGNFQARWALSLAGQVWQWQTHGATHAVIVQAAMNDVANDMAAKYAVLGQPQNKTMVNIQVDGVHQLQDFDKVLHYLRSLTPVQQAQVSNINANSVVIQIETAGTIDQLAQQINQDGKLTPVPVNVEQPQQPNILIYQIATQPKSISQANAATTPTQTTIQ